MRKRYKRRKANTKYDWPRLFTDLQHTVFMTQGEIAKKLKVSQQTVSNCMNNTRNLGLVAAGKLISFMRTVKMDPSNYETGGTNREMIDYLSRNKSRDLARIVSLYIAADRGKRRKMLKQVMRIAVADA